MERRHGRRRKQPERAAEQREGDQQDGAHIAANAQRDIEAGKPQPRRGTEADHALEGAPALGDQVIPRVPDALRLRCIGGGGRRGACRGQREIGDLQLRGQ